MATPERRSPDAGAPRAVSRRRLLGNAARGACASLIAGLGLGAVSLRSTAHAATALRPPGALADADFLGACVRCGLCVRGCPYDTLRLAPALDAHDVATGTPYFVARDVPCEMCEDIPCVAACPTGALSPALDDIDDARMGVAVLVGHESCLNLLGLRCDVCYRVCPLLGKAITLERQSNPRTGVHAVFTPTVHSEACTGCGKCEHACVLPEAAIKVLPPALATGRLGEHYRLGWEEKRRHGESLLGGDVLDLPDRGVDPGPALPARNPKGGFQEFKP